MKKVTLHYGTDEILLDLPENSIIYQSNYKYTTEKAAEMLLKSLCNAIEIDSFEKLLMQREDGKVVIVVSDITRPIPYTEFLPELLLYLEEKGVSRQEILILVATGMHRASTHQEHIQMFGNFVVENYKIVDHDCENETELIELEGSSWSGSRVKLNKHYVEAGFRIITGLVEPHFMAGFSGGRKAICPGLVALNVVRKFHGYKFLSHPNASSAVMKNNPCNDENSSIARLCPPHFSINIVLDNHKKVNTIISGELFSSHAKAVEYVKAACCPQVKETADIAITSSGGYPLDATFYQCIKGIVNCLPAVKTGGEIIAFGGCIEGIGSPEYVSIMEKYAGDYQQFLDAIKSETIFVKDQWQFQMHTRALKKVGQENLHFYTSGIQMDELSQLFVQPHIVLNRNIEKELQQQINEAISKNKLIAIFPEGPYCSPIS